MPGPGQTRYITRMFPKLAIFPKIRRETGRAAVGGGFLGDVSDLSPLKLGYSGFLNRAKVYPTSLKVFNPRPLVELSHFMSNFPKNF